MDNKHYILIIDDNQLAVKLLTNYLSTNYICLSAKNGKEALEILTKYAFSLIICDLNMPIMNGFDFIKEFRKFPEYELIPILVVSSDDNEKSIVSILNSGADDFIAKPLNEQIFVSKVNSLIEKRNLKTKNISESAFSLFKEKSELILFCVGNNKHILKNVFDDIEYEFQYIDSIVTLTSIINTYSISLICVDENADWFFEYKQNIIKTISNAIPIIYFVSEPNNNLTSKFNGLILLKDFNKEFIQNQIKQFVILHAKIKQEYVDTLKKSLMQSTFILDKEKNIANDIFNIEIFHSNYNDIPGGDYYEYFTINNQYSIVILGDIMGKLWNAWYYLPIYLAYIRSIIKFVISRKLKNIYSKPEKFLYLLNDICAKDMHLSEVFSTLTLVVVDNLNKNIHVTSAGGILPIVYNTTTNIATEINISGSLLGIQSNSEYISQKITLNKNDTCIIYTDGYIEASIDTSEKIVGKESFKEIFRTYCSNNSTDFDLFFIKQSNIKKFNDDRSYVLFSLK